MLALIAALIKLASAVAGIAENRQLISAGEAQAIQAGLAGTLENIDAARRAKDAMADGSDPDWSRRVRDKYDRQ